MKDVTKKKCTFAYDFIKATGIIPAWFLFRPKIMRVSEKVPKSVKGGVLIASNHPTFLDPIIVHLAFWKRRLYSIATKDLCKTKLREFFFGVGNCIIIDKENMSMRAMHTVCDALKREKAIVIFPEGAVNQTNEAVVGFKSGVILMAHMSRKPIIPMYIQRVERWYNRTRIMIGEPISVFEMLGERPSMADIDKACEYLHEKELELANLCNSNKEK